MMKDKPCLHVCLLYIYMYIIHISIIFYQYNFKINEKFGLKRVTYIRATVVSLPLWKLFL